MTSVNETNAITEYKKNARRRLEAEAVDVELHYEMYGFERAKGIAEGLRRAKNLLEETL